MAHTVHEGQQIPSFTLAAAWYFASGYLKVHGWLQGYGMLFKAFWLVRV